MQPIAKTWATSTSDLKKAIKIATRADHLHLSSTWVKEATCKTQRYQYTTPSLHFLLNGKTKFDSRNNRVRLPALVTFSFASDGPY